jgi:O-6-methylguanine DNA methyltransferase
MLKYKIIETPLGKMVAAEFDSKLCLLEFVDGSARNHLKPFEKYCDTKAVEEDSPVLAKVAKQLSAYFDGKLKAFDLPLVFVGTEFQKSVWSELIEIPYGKTVNYSWIAARVGRQNAFRAVGQANGSNPISIVVPCHRVIGKSGQLVGYGGKMWRKKWLLELEGALQPSVNLE